GAVGSWSDPLDALRATRPRRAELGGEVDDHRLVSMAAGEAPEKLIEASELRIIHRCAPLQLLAEGPTRCVRGLGDQDDPRALAGEAVEGGAHAGQHLGITLGRACRDRPTVDNKVGLLPYAHPH